MIEALLFTPEEFGELHAATDMIDLYEGSIPPAAKFQVVDLVPEDQPLMEGNV